MHHDPESPGGAVVEITETVPADQTAVLSVAPADQEQPCPTPAAGRICVNVSGAVPRVTATNTKKTSAVELCKVAGNPGVTGSYSFSVRVLPDGTAQTVTVAVGACATIPDLPIGALVEITETVPTGQTAVLSVTPAGAEQPCPTPAAARICVNVSSTVARVTATNTKNKPESKLKLCKVAGPGIYSGAPYSFSIKVLVSGETRTADGARGLLRSC